MKIELYNYGYELEYISKLTTKEAEILINKLKNKNVPWIWINYIKKYKNINLEMWKVIKNSSI